ncbi:MAG: hypothetical protein HZB87_06650 [Desulfatitalea sp.]|nr:hypothetical protein [Desulfatitalea sp.]MBI5895859.1 hypothetical protein [Desulfobacterales bacterium]
MKPIIVLITSLLLTLGAANAALAQGSDHSGHGAAPKGTPSGHGSSHEGMQMGGAMIMLDTVTTDGIKAMAHLQDLRSGAAQGAAGATHSFMVGFEEEGNGTMLTTGRAAIKVTGPDGQTGNAITLAPKDGIFRGDIELKQPGKYTFVVGTRLTDDKARQFSFTYELR